MDKDPSAKSLIAKNFELENSHEAMSEEEFTKHLANRIAYMLDHETDMVFSLLYRLDIYEEKINAVLANRKIVSPDVGLAKLIIERQKERLATKKKFKKEGESNWDFDI